MKITKQQAIDLSNALNSVGNLTGVKFAYAISKNLRTILPVMEDLQKLFKPSSEYIAYQDARIKLAESCAIKKDGQPQKRVENGVEKYVMEDRKDFDKKVKELQKVHKACIDARGKEEKGFKDALKEEVEIDLHLVSVEDLPTNISVKQMQDLFLIVTDPKKIQAYNNMAVH